MNGPSVSAMSTESSATTRGFDERLMSAAADTNLVLMAASARLDGDLSTCRLFTHAGVGAEAGARCGVLMSLQRNGAAEVVDDEGGVADGRCASTSRRG